MPIPVTAPDPLLEELNGALAKTSEPVFIDPAPGQPLPFAQALEVTAAPRGHVPHVPLPKSAQVDKLHSKAAGGFGYRVTVEGDYFAKSIERKGHVLKPYRLPFNLPSLTNVKGEGALGIIVGASRPGGGLLKAALKKFDPLAESFHTHTIVSVEPLAGAPEPTSLAYMSFEALKLYVRDNEVPLNVEDYWNVEHLREDVIDLRMNFADNRDAKTGLPLSDTIRDGRGLGSKKSPLDRIKERHELRKEEKQLTDMNEGV